MLAIEEQGSLFATEVVIGEQSTVLAIKVAEQTPDH